MDFFSYPKLPKAKSQRRKDVPLGEPGKVHFFIARGKKLSHFLHKQKKHLASIVKTLNYI
jgi:hypothetical protein